MKVAVAQLEAYYYGKDLNEERVLRLTEEALADEIDLILFPEGMNLGYFIMDQTRPKKEALLLALSMAPSLSSPWVEELAKQAKKGIHIACGIFLKIAGEKLVNAVLLMSPTGECFVYHKSHLYHLKEVREEDYVVKGDELGVVDTGLARIGISICYELNFPEVARTLALQGAQIILIPAAWPKFAGATWDVLLPARALENQTYVIACGQTGEEYYGHSKIIDYSGSILAELGNEEGLCVAEIDLAKQEKWRKKVTFFKDRRPQLYKLQ